MHKGPVASLFSNPKNFTVTSSAFYVWNNITTTITDVNGDAVQWLPGDNVTVTISASDDGQDVDVVFNSTGSGVIDIALTGGSLCLKDVQWAIGGNKNEMLPKWNAENQEYGKGGEPFNNCTADYVAANGSVVGVGPKGGTRMVFVWYPAWDAAPAHQTLVADVEDDDVDDNQFSVSQNWLEPNVDD